MSIAREYRAVRNILSLLRGINIYPAYFLIPVGLGMVAALFEGASVGLLIPLLRGFLDQDFSFVMSLPYLGSLLRRLPFSLSGDRHLFAFLVSAFIVAVLLKNVLKYLATLSMAYLGERAVHHLRKRIFGRYLSFGKLYFDRTTVGHHAMVLTHFTEHALAPVINITKYMNALFSLLVYLCVMAVISWQLTLFALPLFLILHLAVRRMIDSVRHLSQRIAEQGSALGKVAVEILSTISLVKAYGMERVEEQHLTRISDEKASLDFRVKAVQEIILPFQEVITLFAAGLLFFGMLWLMVRGGMRDAPPFIVYFYLILNAAMKFGTVTGFRSTLARAHGPLAELTAVFDDAGKVFVPEGKHAFAGLQRDITFRKLRFAYAADRQILYDLSLTIPCGQMTALVGPTGGGKTTIVHLLMRFYDCPPESIFLDDVDIRQFTIHSLLQHIALVSQETLLLHDSLRANILYGLRRSVDERTLWDVLERARLDGFVRSLPQGLATLVGDRGVKLSGGEKQRVAIARALLKNAAILILDEATSSLDSATERLIQEAIDEAVRGRTSIVIAHRLSTIRHADTIAVIDGGRVVEHGTLATLLAQRGLFHLLWEQQKFH